MGAAERSSLAGDVYPKRKVAAVVHAIEWRGVPAPFMRCGSPVACPRCPHFWVFLAPNSAASCVIPR